MAATLLQVQDLAVVFHTRRALIHAVNSVEFDLRQSEILAVVGESGCGKSVTMLSLLGLLKSPPAEVVNGRAFFEDTDLLASSAQELREIRGRKIGFVFQDPMTSLNPALSIGYQIMEPLRRHLDLPKRAARERAAELLDLVGIPDPVRCLSNYPHHLSGGMRQRAMIAIALSCGPRILIADEPTTALDVTIQAQIIELVLDLQQSLDMAVIWITHDLSVVSEIADRVLVMYGGRIVEQATARELFSNPVHPYTRALIGTVPTTGIERLETIPGQTPTLFDPPQGCAFHPRCEQAFSQCRSQLPELVMCTRGHDAACFLASPEDAHAC